jgi:hypothetical protein
MGWIQALGGISLEQRYIPLSSLNYQTRKALSNSLGRVHDGHPIHDHIRCYEYEAVNAAV